MKLIFNALLFLSSSAFATGYDVESVTQEQLNLIAAGAPAPSSKVPVVVLNKNQIRLICFTPSGGSCAQTIFKDKLKSNDSCTCQDNYGVNSGTYHPKLYLQARKSFPPASAADMPAATNNAAQ